MTSTISTLIFHEYNPSKRSVKRIINKKLTPDASLPWAVSRATSAISGDKSEYHQGTGISDDQGLDSVSWPPLPSREPSPTSIPTP